MSLYSFSFFIIFELGTFWLPFSFNPTLVWRIHSVGVYWILLWI
jgi:hypothetical protein